MNKSYPLCICVSLVLLLSACVSSRNVVYFDINKDTTSQIQFPREEAHIQKNDLLSITVTSMSSEASQMFNMPNTVAGSGSNATPGGYLVDVEGNIQFPVIGVVRAAGLTKMQLQDTLTRILNEQKLLLNPIVSIRNLNYKVTVLGEVLRPSVINVPSEKINLLEAIGFAGDLTLFANRKNVLLIREENNQRTFKVMNLNSNEIFSSPYFYLKPNDIIYVEPNKTKINSTSPARQWLPIVFSALSLATIIFTRLTR